MQGIQNIPVKPSEFTTIFTTYEKSIELSSNLMTINIYKNQSGMHYR